METHPESDAEHIPAPEPRKDPSKAKRSRKNTPTRPVYDDFETAFSSITFSSGKDREDRRDISLQQPPTATFRVHAEEPEPLCDGSRAKIPSTSNRNVDLSFGSGLGPRKKSSIPLAWPRDSFELIDMSGVRRQVRGDPAQADKLEMSFADSWQNQTICDRAEGNIEQTNLDKRRDPLRVDESSSLRDSTLEKIVRQYAVAKNQLFPLNPDHSEGRKHGNFLLEEVGRPRQLKSPGMAPNDWLPRVPLSVDQLTTSDIMAQTSSYGDTRNLLGITFPESSNTDLHVRAENPIKDIFRSPDSNRNPFRRGSHINNFSLLPVDAVSPPVSAPMGSGRSKDSSHSHGGGRQGVEIGSGLERDISRELRRVSVLSNNIKSTTQKDGDGGFQSSTNSTERLRYAGAAGKPILKTQNVHNEGFYDQSAIPQAWLGSQHLNHVRVPIRHHTRNVSLEPAAKLHPPADGGGEIQNLDAKEEDTNDWETVGEGGAINEGSNTYNMLGDLTNRATSSIANESDDGSASLFHYGHTDFSSTERIAAHEGVIEYSNDYRFRDPGIGGVPVLLPSTRSLAPNGEPLNTSRNISPYTLSNAFSTKHTNPFQSPSPHPKALQEPLPEVIRPDQVKLREENIRTSESWMNDFADPGPAVKHNHPKFADAAPDFSDQDHPNSYQYIIDRSLRRQTSAASEATSAQTSDSTSPLANRASRSGMEPLPITPPQAHLLGGPPGSFYQDAVARSDTDDQIRDAAVAVEELPPQSRRSISLLQMLGEDEEPCFHYLTHRPVFLGEWEALYTHEQLDRFRARDQSDDNQNSFNRSPGNARLPTLNRWNLPIKPNLEKYVKRLSTILLILCAIFPPMFILYGEGYMDRVAKCLTHGEVRHLNESHKKVAFWLGLITGILAMVAMGVAIGIAISRPVN